ncbi:MAG: hypothetical protein IJW00_07650 [Clostridia bacterium]|nr:hypothetical protein [Clostridia bacterium]
MKFHFESLDHLDLVSGTSYLMDFGTINSQQDAALAEGKLLSAFGQPAFTSVNCENSFNYVIKATSEDGNTAILSVYNMGMVHIGAGQANDFTLSAAHALVEYVNSFAPADYERTIYYLDFNLQIDVQVKNGKVMINQSQIPPEKADALFMEMYPPF